jgi:hypothetical protein
MDSSSREEIVEVLDALEAGYKRALDLTFDVLTTPERLRVLERWEQLRRWHPAVEHPLINQLVASAIVRVQPLSAEQLRIRAHSTSNLW